jgi:hypothetical protein
MLVRATERRVPIEELTIETVYGSFAKSHFNPLRDSLRIYFVFLRFIGLSMLTAGIDYATFALVYADQHNITTSCSRRSSRARSPARSTSPRTARWCFDRGGASCRKR